MKKIPCDPDIEASTESIIQRFKERGIDLHIGRDVTVDFQTLILVCHNVFYDGIEFGRNYPN